MEIKRLNDELLAEFHEFFAMEVREQQLLYKPSVSIRFTEEIRDLTTINLVALNDGKIIAFANASYKAETNVGYITFILVAKNQQFQGIGGQLYEKLQTELLACGAKKLEISFFNPINLEWLVPRTASHDHPNAPGVDIASSAYIFFKNRGFLDVAMQNVYYQNLQTFQYTDDVKNRLKKLNDGGYEIAYFNPEIHTGLNELFDDFGNELWRETIMNNVNNVNPLPVLVVIKNDEVFGFTGPLDVANSGRGYFAGIGIHSSHRALGAGKLLFSALCNGLKSEGATFMTLFTGETNPARRIYESAGFKIVRSFMVMRKEVE